MINKLINKEKSNKIRKEIKAEESIHDYQK
jgi:hypothetical protein